jgi:transcriptional regulator with GAF, ATPase, and Fis domain
MSTSTAFGLVARSKSFEGTPRTPRRVEVRWPARPAEAMTGPPRLTGIIGSSGALTRVLTMVDRVAPTDATVLITGESGTGKELIARAIHQCSSRANRSFVRVNCAAIPPSLIASELFGYEKGAFTGALQRHLGRFEKADGGTIFLDEIGDIPAETQVALLRVLQEHEFERVGGTQPVPIDVRILAATNCDLRAAVTSAKFRLDLFYRLNVFPIHMPPLRDRKEDLPSLIEHLIASCAVRIGKSVKGLDARSMNRLVDYDWPGNIRELQNVLERAAILCEGELASIEDEWIKAGDVTEPAGSAGLSSSLMSREKELIEAPLEKSNGRVTELKPPAGPKTSQSSEALRQILSETERTQILHALEGSNWVIAGPNGAASRLGMKRTTLQGRMQKLGIRLLRGPDLENRPLPSVISHRAGRVPEWALRNSSPDGELEAS